MTLIVVIISYLLKIGVNCYAQECLNLSKKAMENMLLFFQGNMCDNTENINDEEDCYWIIADVTNF